MGLNPLDDHPPDRRNRDPAQTLLGRGGPEHRHALEGLVRAGPLPLGARPARSANGAERVLDHLKVVVDKALRGLMTGRGMTEPLTGTLG